MTSVPKKIFRAKSLVLGILFLASNEIFSQDNDKEWFNRHYSQSIERTKSLYAIKGMFRENDDDYSSGRYDFANEYTELLNSYKAKKDFTGIIFYFYTNDSLEVWLLARDKFYHSATRISRDSLLTVEMDLRRALKVDQLTNSRMPVKRGLTPTSTQTKIKTLHQAIDIASNILFPASIAEEIKNLEHIMILPELNIGRFPFYILSPAHNNTPLIDKSSISFIPRLVNPSSVTMMNYYKMGTRYLETFSRPLIVGNPEYASNIDYILPQLPGAAEEAAEVAGLLKCKYYTGKHASISAMQQLAENADLLYFATHGVFDMDKMLDGSFLAFAPDSNNNNGLWMAKKIQQSDLQAKMAVLSACQTGIGKIYDGGFVSIGQSFLIAGVPHTITSLWSVDDASTKKLMLHFMEEMKTPDYYYPASQLRKAILKYREGDKEIANWAPFTVFGFTY